MIMKLPMFMQTILNLIQRKNKHLLEMARTLLFQMVSNLVSYFFTYVGKIVYICSLYTIQYII